MKKFLSVILIFSVPFFLFSQTWDDLNQKGIDSYEKAEYTEAESYFLEALDFAEKNNGKISTEYTVSLSYIIEIARILNNKQDLLNYTYEIINLIPEVYGENVLEYALYNSSYADLIIEDDNDFKKSLKYRLKSLEVLEKSDAFENPNYPITLFNVGYTYYELEEYLNAKSYLLDALKIYEEQENAGEALELLYYYLSFTFLYLEDFDNCITYSKKGLEFIEKSNFLIEKESVELLYNIKESYIAMSDFFTALDYSYKILRFIENKLGVENINYATSLSNLALIYQDLGQYDKALYYSIQALENEKKYHKEINENYHVTLNNIAIIYQDLGQYDKALEYAQEALRNSKIFFENNHIDYGIKLNTLSQIYQDLGVYEKALEYGLEALTEMNKTNQKINIDKSILQRNISTIYHNLGKFNEAKQYGLIALEAFEELLGKENLQIGISLNNLSILHADIGQYDKALEYAQEALKIRKKVFGEDHPDFGTSLSNLASIYKDLGQYDKALEYGLAALTNKESTLGKDHDSYCTSLNNIGVIYQDLGQYEKALPLYLEALENTEKALGKDHPKYGIRLNNLALLYSDMGQYDKAVPLYIEVLENTKKTLGKEHPDYAKSLNNFAQVYSEAGQYESALSFFLEALNITENTLGKEHPDYGKSLNNLAQVYSEAGQYESALSFFLEVLNITENTLGKEHPDYGKYLNNLAQTYSDLSQYENALSFFLEALNITENTLGKEHPDYGTYLNNLALLYSETGQYQKVLPLTLEAIKNINQQIQKVFSFMSEKEKENFINTINFNFKVYQSFFTLYSTDKQEVSQYAYDIELNTKGMILQSGIQTRQAIHNSGDSTAIEKFDVWSFYKNLLAKQYSLPIAERRSDLKELEDKAENAEGELSRLSAIFSENKALSGVRWQDIQKQLGNNEVAIEFAAFNYRNSKEWTDSTLYIALVLGKNDNHPRLITLFEQKQLDSLLASKGSSDAEFVSNLYQNSNLYELVWQPLEQYVPKGSAVYFAPSGSLHQIAMHAISLPSGSVLSDVYNLHQLSTTAMLTRQKEKTNTLPKNLALFGGIRYDATSTSPQTPTNEDYLTQKLSFSLPQDLNRGSESWTYLPGTLKEVEKIATIADKQNINYTLHIGKEAEEEKFKQLSGKKSPEVIHIATHGFFFPHPKQDKPDNLMRLDNEKQVYKQSDNPLYRSGLLFAGANKAWLSEEQPASEEDGILSAYEVSYQYLGNTKLVVLSACETGLGDIKGSEGVFGLQRAFKASGVKYLMMSLWKVPDAATSEFMETFYTEWFNGKTIEQAFQNTQNQMKTKYPNEPYKWAGFVLVE